VQRLLRTIPAHLRKGLKATQQFAGPGELLAGGLKAWIELTQPIQRGTQCLQVIKMRLQPCDVASETCPPQPPQDVRFVVEVRGERLREASGFRHVADPFCRFRGPNGAANLVDQHNMTESPGDVFRIRWVSPRYLSGTETTGQKVSVKRKSAAVGAPLVYIAMRGAEELARRHAA
jgi:hypothetical protein